MVTAPSKLNTVVYVTTSKEAKAWLLKIKEEKGFSSLGAVIHALVEDAKHKEEQRKQKNARARSKK